MSEKHESKGKSDSERDFLIAGAKTYLQVEAAIAKFRTLVYEGAKRSFEGHLSELQEVLGEKLDYHQLKASSSTRMADHLYAEDFSYDSWGAKLGIKNVGILSSYIWWHYRESVLTIDACVSITPNRKDVRERLIDAFRKAAGPKVRKDGSEIYFVQTIPPDQFTSFEAVLDTLMKDWIGYWRKIDGLSPYVK